MKKQKIRFYAALLCSSMVFSLVSTPVSAAETGQMLNPPTSTEGPGSPESASGNEAAAVLNGLYVSALTANRVAEVTTAKHLTEMLADSSVVKITRAENIDIDSTLTVNRTVTLDLNGNVLKMNGSGSVIKVESGGNLTIQDSNTSTPHKFTPGGDGLWVLDASGSEIVNGGIITGGTGMPPGVNYSEGGGVYVSAGAALTMNGGSIVGCKAESGGGVCIVYDYTAQKTSEFIMKGGSIIGCTASSGGGVLIRSGCRFTMNSDSEIRCCTARTGGGVTINASSSLAGSFTLAGGKIHKCKAYVANNFLSRGGGISNEGEFIMESGCIENCTSPSQRDDNKSSGVYNKGKLFILRGGTIDGNITNNTTLNADGGTVNGELTNNDQITGEDLNRSTTFNDKVTNNGTIRKGTFTNEVINESSGTINGGTFTGTVENKDGTISGGDFSKATLNGMLVITFDPDNGDQSITQEVNWSKDGATLTAPDPVPTNGGHSLDGWYYDNNGTETKWNFDMDTVKCTMTLKAKWELSTYSVTLQTDGGTIASGKEVTGYTYGTGAVLPTANDITREGYRFDGWYADSSFSGSPVTEITGTDTGDKVFYAKWMRNTTPIVPGNDTNNIVEQYKTDDNGSGEQTDLDVPAPVVKNTTSYLTYTVQAGDTLWAIARKYNCSITEIVAANSDRIKNPNRIHAGWQLKIPQSGAPITGGTPDAVLPENKKSGIYIVRQGDTLWKIARKYGCSVAEIISLNRELIRNPALIYSGWELKVPQN
ncbi:LysM peptidoglycan-binding domain-containing protein [Firmicutes bacterium OM08-11AC]|nr:LysM peptidoglycan-binding domain-containing protein [Firmicutes bacterium OM08-11AC]